MDDREALSERRPSRPERVLQESVGPDLPYLLYLRARSRPPYWGQSLPRRDAEGTQRARPRRQDGRMDQAARSVRRSACELRLLPRRGTGVTRIGNTGAPMVCACRRKAASPVETAGK